MKIEAFENNVVVLPVEETETKGGIKLLTPPNANTKRGVVVSIGCGRMTENGYRDTFQSLKVGDVIVYDSYAPNTEHLVEGTKYVLLRRENVRAVLSE